MLNWIGTNERKAVMKLTTFIHSLSTTSMSNRVKRSVISYSLHRRSPVIVFQPAPTHAQSCEENPTEEIQVSAGSVSHGFRVFLGPNFVSKRRKYGALKAAIFKIIQTINSHSSHFCHHSLRQTRQYRSVLYRFYHI